MSHETSPEIRYTDIAGGKLKLPPEVLPGIEEKLGKCLTWGNCDGQTSAYYFEAKHVDEAGKVTDRRIKFCELLRNGESVDIPDNSY
ncbi:MAG: hypothetical protein ABIE14_01520 [Patescibacteria group bacterium]